MKLVTHLPTSNKEWKDDYIFVCGDNWEGLPWEEKDDSFIRVRRAWGTPPASGVYVCFSSSFGRVILSSSHVLVLIDALLFIAALKHPKLDQDGINKVLRALHHREHRYRTFIQLEVLALYSFGPELNETVLFIQEINQKSEYLSSDGLCVLCVGRCFEKILFTGMATAKLNKEKLKKMMSQKDEAPISLGRGGRRIRLPRRRWTREIFLLPNLKNRPFQTRLRLRQLRSSRSPTHLRPTGQLRRRLLCLRTPPWL